MDNNKVTENTKVIENAVVDKKSLITKIDNRVKTKVNHYFEN